MCAKKKEVKTVELNEIGEIIEKNLNLFEKVLNLITKYGYKKVILGVTLVVLVFGLIIVYKNQKEIINKIVQEQQIAVQVNEARNLEFRVKEINPRVEAILYKLMLCTNADRVFILEMHNGVQNPTGLPFAYADMTYEAMKSDSTESVMFDYERLNLSKYPFSGYISKNKIFFGKVSEINSIDKRLQDKLINGNVNFLGIYSLTSSDVEIGWVGISFLNDNEPKNPTIVKGHLLNASQKISILLDINNNLKP
jgi:hypothetical protein